jgi:hypothetical protein
VGVSHPDAPGAKGGSDGVGVNVKARTDSGQRPALPVQVYRLAGLLVIEPAMAQGHAVALQLLGDSGAVDPELDRQILHGGPGAVAVYERHDVGRGKGCDHLAPRTYGAETITVSVNPQPVQMFGP